MNKTEKKVVIIGGGAAGLAVAVAIKMQAKQNLKVIILERHSKLGRKLLASGNGRCNLTNSNVDESYYNNPNFLNLHLKTYGYNTIKNFYNNLGIMLSFPDNEGRVYPITYSALSVLDCYKNAIDKLNIEVKLDCQAKDIFKTEYGFKIILQDNTTLNSDYLIFAYGSTAQTGFDNSFNLEGLKKIPSNCSLCPVLGKKSELKGLENVRSKAIVTLEYNKNKNSVTYSEKGEVLFKKEQISGIVIFNISSILARLKINSATIFIDLLPDYSIKEIKAQLINNSKYAKNLTDLLIGICAKGITQNILSRIDKKYNMTTNWNDSFFDKLASFLKHLEFGITQNTNHAEAQVISGGIDTNCVNNLTFESKSYKNLFIIGEALNIDGVCGGFNLHFAVSSALSAAKEICKNASN